MSVYLILLYIILSFSTFLGDYFLDLGFRLYWIDIPILMLLIISVSSQIKYKFTHKSILLIYAFQIVIIFYAMYSIYALNNPINNVLGQVRTFGFYPSLFITSFTFFKTEKDFDKFLNAFWLVIITLFLISLERLFSGKGYSYLRFSTGDVTRYFSYIEAALLIISLFYSLSLLFSFSFTKKWPFFSFIFSAIGLLISNYRSVWATTIILLTVFLIKKTRLNSKNVIRNITLIILAGIGLVYYILHYYMETIYNKFDYVKLEGAINGRLLFWDNALYKIYKSPILGNGIGDFEQYGNIATFHNDYLQFLNFVGILGFLITIFLLIKINSNQYKINLQIFPNKFMLFITSFRWGIVGILIISIIEPFILQPPTIMIVFSIWGIVVKYKHLSSLKSA